MDIKFVLTYYFLGGILFQGSSGDFSCFKKFRRKQNVCGGLIRRKSISAPELCCSGLGEGFTQLTLDILRRNTYTCESCEEWERQNNKGPTTPLGITEFVCFRKYKERQQQCGGPLVKRSRVPTVEECCTGTGNGFTYTGLDQRGKNRYTCTSCNEWKKEQGITTTTDATTTEGLGEWSDWSTCSATCGSGRQTRYRQCNNCDRNHHMNKQVKPCLVHYYCPEHGNWGSWLSWEDCSQACDGGVRRRERLCDDPSPRHGGADCEGEDWQEGRCNEEPCSVDGHWGPWSRFGRCSQTCGRGEMLRSRECNSPAPAGDGRLCRGPSTDGRRCENRKCPTHGGWSTWEDWSTCSSTCGTGTRTRTRECNRPIPRFGGKNCHGLGEEEESCRHPTQCPVDGGWSHWSKFGRCRAGPCARGHRLRVRECDSPKPQNRGRMCVGRGVEKIPCMNEEGCPVDGGWCDYGLWSSCSATCLGYKDTQSRVRACYCPPPKNGGAVCEGDSIDVRECEGFNICDKVPSVDVDAV